MCGIAGVVSWQSDPAGTEAAARRMLAALGHRGPDGDGVWCGTEADGVTVALAHTRLAIIDLSDAARQPMARGQSVVTYNGETYNHRTLRRELEDLGRPFTTGSDTEVVLHAIDQWGPDAVARLDGMFAFACWDRRRRRLLLVRDRLGIKPLYYARGSGFLAFASEIRALLASGLVPRRLDPEGLWHYLGYQTTPTPSTLIAGVQMLGAARMLTVDASGEAQQQQYWDLRGESPHEHATARPAARRRIGELLDAAVASHLVSDVPVGVFLSGGIDSGALLSVLASQGRTPSTFTVAVGDRSLDESEDARAVARSFGADHHELRVSEAELLETMPAIFDAVDHPSGDGVNTYVVSSAVRRAGFKVALSGLGGDEIFGGYPSFRRLKPIMPAVGRWGRLPRPMRRAAAGLVRAVGGGRVSAAKAAALLESDGTMASVWPITRQLFSDAERRALLAPHLGRSQAQRDSYHATLAAAPAADEGIYAAVSYAEARAYMHDVLLRDTDQMSMAHGLEVRVPLLDHRLVDYVVSLPDAIKHGPGGPKALLVASLPCPLPASVAGRAKRGFTLPFDSWIRGALRPLCARELGERGLEARGLFRPGEVTKVWQRFLDRRPGVTWSRVWTLVALNRWLDRQGIDGPVESGASAP